MGTSRTRYHDLQRLARRQRRDTQELLTLYALEGWLHRLVMSAYRDQLVLKGGMLLAAFDQRRPTRDLDLQAQQVESDVETVRDVVAEIASVPVDDGLRFYEGDATGQTIRDGDEYNGVRISLDALLHTAHLRVKVDVNVGDPIWPAPQTVAVPRLIDPDPLVLRGYPIQMVLAEKLVTAVARGTANTRWRDFADIYLLVKDQTIDGLTVVEAVRRVAMHRRVTLIPLSQALDGMDEIGQQAWGRWRVRQDLTDRLPERLSHVLDLVNCFGEPVVAGEIVGSTWQPHGASWA